MNGPASLPPCSMNQKPCAPPSPNDTPSRSPRCRPYDNKFSFHLIAFLPYVFGAVKGGPKAAALWRGLSLDAL